MSHQEKESDKDEIQVIPRDTHDYSQVASMDTPNFISSLDLPTPTDADGNYFDQFDSEHHNQLQNGTDDAHVGPSLSPLTEYINSDYNNESVPYSSALTRIPYQPALPQLSDSVISENLKFSDPSVIPEYVNNNVNSAIRPQPLIVSGKRKKESQGPKTRPAFVMKIWSMVNDPANHDFIRWNEDGQTFQVVHREEFMKNILPKYFKHNNFASFVRQLNMYGWHKVQDVNSGSLKDERNSEEVLQFKNPHFVRGREDLLDNIVRNKTGNTEDTQESNSLNIQLVMNELESIKMNQIAIIEDVRRMRKDNQMLWNESFNARERHQKQSQTLDKIMKFLAAVYGNSAGKIFEVENGVFNSNQVSSYNGSNFSTSNPGNKPRLMLMDQAYRSSGSTPSKSSSSPATKRDSVEEIARNTPDTRKNSEPFPYANKIYDQIMNQDSTSAASPSQLFPELSTSYFNSDAVNGSGGLSKENEDDSLQGLEQNILRQGQALSQVQDWIQTLASRQEKQQQQLKEQKSHRSEENSPSNSRFDDFDVNDFLDNTSVNSSNPKVTPMDDESSTDDKGASKKRALDADNKESSRSKKRLY